MVIKPRPVGPTRSRPAFFTDHRWREVASAEVHTTFTAVKEWGGGGGPSVSTRVSEEVRSRMGTKLTTAGQEGSQGMTAARY